MKDISISAIVVTKNNEDIIKNCLESISWVDEIIIVDTGSTDKTIDIAKIFTPKVFSLKTGSFSEWRNYGAEKSKNNWLFYLDSDEEVTEKLKGEIIKTITDSEYPAYAIPRKNILLGKFLKHGGWWPDYVLRLMKKDCLKDWEGNLHEQPKIKGKVGKLEEPLIHTSHRNLTEMVEKTNEWSEVEARLLFESKHPKMTWWRFFSVAFKEIWFRGFRKLGFLDGPIGIIEVIYQAFSRMITYAKLWELQVTKEK